MQTKQTPWLASSRRRFALGLEDPWFFEALQMDALYKFRSVRKDDAVLLEDGVVEVKTPHAFNQAAGYLRFASAKNGPLYYRGQSKLYRTLYPTAHRMPNNDRRLSQKVLSGNNAHLKDIISRLKSGNGECFLKKTPREAYEPILQHYGIKTRYVDVVENPWVALWFACINVFVDYDRYMYFRSPDIDDTSKFVFVLLIQPGQPESHKAPSGFYSSKEAEVVDLRVAAPSLYLRPHAQHGLLIARRNTEGPDAADLFPMVRGVLRVQLDRAWDWIGGGNLLNIHHLFPPPPCDPGYKQLFEKYPVDAPPTLGWIKIIGA